MNWGKIWSHLATRSTDAMKQVGRTVNNAPMSADLLAEIVQDIIEKTQMKPTDVVLDICCGNGILTQQLAPHCAEIVGIDKEKKLIERAEKEFSAKNIGYFTGDALEVQSIVNQSFDVIILYFSFQYFDTFSRGEKMIAAMISLLKPNACILIGDVPDGEKLAVFYPKIIDRFRYWISYWLRKNNMGKFWKYEEIVQICEKYGAKVRLCSQKKKLPYSHYRVDFLISVNS